MILKRVAAVALGAVLAVGLVACGSASKSGSASSTMTSDAMTSSPMSSDSGSAPGMSSPAAMSSSSGMASSADAAAAGLVGPGCAAYAKANATGAASIGGMAEAPVAEAASANPLLTTLVAAVSGKLNPKVNLVQTLDSAEFTVLAPVDDAFAKVPAGTVDKLKTDDALLTKILTYHVIAGQLDPSQIVGTHKTVEGDTVTVTGSGDNLKVNSAAVICGGIKTKNATVYLIDTVLTPTT